MFDNKVSIEYMAVSMPINEVFNDYLQSGVEVHFYDGKEERDDIVYLLDYKNPLNNSFHVVNQWTFVEYSEKRPDVIVFVNGMPLVVFELKSPSREETDASHVNFPHNR